MKYLLYRALGDDIEKNVKQHELVAVEYGKNISEVENALIKDATDDLAGMPEYKGCETAAYAPELRPDYRKVRRYQYQMMGVIYPPVAEKNIIVYFGIVEAEDE